jgi:teichuronic acid exporter
MRDNLNSKTFSSLIWKLLERGGTQGIQFIIQIFLARLLSPNDYGVIALITVFIALANVFVQSGFSTALIQKQNADEEDFSSVFYVSLLVASILYMLLFLTAPLIANFYNIQELVNIIRVLSLTLFLGAFNSIQNAIISRKMAFKNLFYSSLGAIIVSGVIGIIFAYKGFGVWTLVYQQLINQFSICLILWFTVKWRPQLLFSFQRVKELFSFGGKLLLSVLIDTGYREITNLIVGKIYTPVMLGYYNRGNQFPNLIVNNLNGSIQSVIFPVLASVQDDKGRIKDITRRAIVTSSYIVFPAMMGLIVIAEPMIKLILTEKWLPCVPYLRLFCLSYALWPIHTANLQAINAIGRSDIFLKLEIIKKIVGVSIIIITSRYSPLMMALGTVFSGIIGSFINSYPNKKLLNYSYFEQMKDILPSVILSIIMGFVTYSVIFLGLSDLITIILQIIVGGVAYILLSYIVKLECFMYLLNIIYKKKRG